MIMYVVARKDFWQGKGMSHDHVMSHDQYEGSVGSRPLSQDPAERQRCVAKRSKIPWGDIYDNRDVRALGGSALPCQEFFELLPWRASATTL